MSTTVGTKPVNSQAHLLRPSKFGDGKTRNWSMYVFFRVLSRREMARSLELLTKALKTKNKTQQQFYFDALRSELISPRRLNHSKSEAWFIAQKEKEGIVIPSKDAPADEFFQWLKVAASADVPGFVKRLEKVLKPLKTATASDANLGALNAKQSAAFTDMSELLIGVMKNPAVLADFLGKVSSNFDDIFGAGKDIKNGVEKLLKSFGKNQVEAGLTALSGGLPLAVLYEMLRQVAVAALDDQVENAAGPAYDEVQSSDRLNVIKAGGRKLYDSVACNYAFTHSGLDALQLDDTILKSFPEPFIEGMAARAERLGDTGESAPENWHGELGQKSVHGYFTGGFLAGAEGNPSNEQQWEKLRADVADFNDRSSENGINLRLFINALFRLLGMEIVHLELAQDPYRVADDGSVMHEPHRMEHFGFRDGISQPFVNMNLGAPAAGGGTPGSNRSWAPIAPGEIMLDQLDEDGHLPQRPYNAALREGGTFLVFRKLEQDVEGYRRFLAKMRPDNQAAQKKLSAQFMGRWPNGCAMVHSPDEEGYVGPENEGELNNFLFAADDPDGKKCPLSSHIRRANPRDIGGNNDIRRHRILRRGMPYGGPFLADGTKGDGKKRGLFFICANSRIDLQFEVVQSVWMNRDGFAGQTGLNKCPITGNNNGAIEDQFLEAGSGAPITRIPKFATTRGGDYFFAPGVNTLRQIAAGEKFALDKKDIPYEGVSMGDAVTPTLYDIRRIGTYARQILDPTQQAINAVRVELPPAPKTLAAEERADTDIMVEVPGIEKPVVFIAKHQDVSHVISSQSKDGKALFSVTPYMEAGNRLLRGGNLLIGTEDNGPTEKARERLTDILQNAWMFLHANGDFMARLETITTTEINKALQRSAATGEIDLVDDIATNTVYEIVSKLFGTPGPEWLTELAVSIPFARQHVGQIYPDWLSIFEGREPPANPGCKTMQVWSAFLFLDIVGNVPQTKELKALGSQAAAEMLSHFDALLYKASHDVPIPVPSQSGGTPSFKNRKAGDPITLLDSFLLIAEPMCKKYKYSKEAYLADVRGLLLEVVGSPMTIIPANFASIMEAVFQMRLDLPTLVPMLEKPPQFGKPGSADNKMSGLHRFIYETTRINPTVKLLVRECMANTKLPGGADVKKGDWVTSIMGAANLDFTVFPNSQEFSLGPYDNGSARPYDKYLLFGAEGGERQCWGKDKIALYVLENCIRGASKLEGLSQLAGPKGEVYEPFRIAFGLKARYGNLSGLV